MYTGSKKLNKAQAKAQEYVQKHKLEKLISEMVNSLVHTRDKKPIVYMIKYLANYCTQEELEENQIKIEGQLPQRIPLMNYPEFSEDCTSLLKAHLTKEVWSAMKKRATHLGGKIQLCVQCGVYDNEDDIGIYATDEEAYKVFDDLFTPIVQDLHPDYDLKVNYRNEFELVSALNLQKLAKLKNKITFIRVSARRNFKDYPFTPMMSTQIKFQVEKKIVETLGEIYGQYHQLAKIDDETKAWLDSVGIDISRQKPHDAAGINEDWPNGRGVFVDEHKAFVILVNFEDHIQVFTVGQDGDFNNSLKTLNKILNKFDKMGYAKHSTLGFLTASPKNLGTTLKFTCHLKLQEKHSADDRESFEGTYSCKIDEKASGDNEYEFTYLKTLAKNLTENDAINEFSECLSRFTENEPKDDSDPQQEEEKAVDEVVKDEPQKVEATQEETTNRGAEVNEPENNEQEKEEETQKVDAEIDAPVENKPAEASEEAAKEALKEESKTAPAEDTKDEPESEPSETKEEKKEEAPAEDSVKPEGDAQPESTVTPATEQKVGENKDAEGEVPKDDKKDE